MAFRLLCIIFIYRGGSRIFFRRGCTRLLLYFSTNKPHSFFFFYRIPVVSENRRSSRGGGGVRTRCTLPLDPPLLHYYRIPKDPEASGMYSSATIPLRASLTGGLLLSTMPFAVPPNDPYSPCNHQSYLFPSFRT